MANMKSLKKPKMLFKTNNQQFQTQVRKTIKKEIFTGQKKNGFQIEKSDKLFFNLFF